jgi:hypothetical protein
MFDSARAVQLLRIVDRELNALAGQTDHEAGKRTRRLAERVGAIILELENKSARFNPAQHGKLRR